MTSEGLKYFLFASIISAENEEYTEGVKQDIINRFEAQKELNKSWNNYDWNYILDSIGNKEKIDKLAELLRDDTTNLKEK